MKAALTSSEIAGQRERVEVILHAQQVPFHPHHIGSQVLLLLDHGAFEADRTHGRIGRQVELSAKVRTASILRARFWVRVSSLLTRSGSGSKALPGRRSPDPPNAQRSFATLVN